MSFKFRLFISHWSKNRLHK